MSNNDLGQQHRRLYGSCARKSYFASYKSASHYARQVRRTGGPQLRPYACRYCNGWHLTTVKPILKPKGSDTLKESDT